MRPVSRNDESSPGVCRHPARHTRHPSEPTSIAQLLGRSNRLISEIGMRGLEHACNAVDLVTATVYPVESAVHGVFVEDLVDCHASTRGVVFTE
jgi:hypothetical protein